MNKSPTWLLEHTSNVYSQFGEDGVIDALLELIPNRNNWCVEFGAWDGRHLMNTRNLIEHRDYSAVLVEADPAKFAELQKNYAGKPQVVCQNGFVGFNGDDNLDVILASTPIPQDFDLLSIDIDGNDYHVWKAVIRYAPKAVVIEFNPTIPTAVRFVQPANPSVNQGSSLLALVDLGREKGYELVCVMHCNAFFVKKEFFPAFGIESNSAELMRKDLSAVTHVFAGYDGHIFIEGGTRISWHGIPLRESKIQILPRLLRKFPSNYSRIEWFFFSIYCLFFHTTPFLQKLLQRIANRRSAD